MPLGYEKPASDFLELASEQRLEIIHKLQAKTSKLSMLAKELGVTAPEVFRNLERLEKAAMIEKGTDGYYYLATYGKTLCSLIPSLSFISGNKEYFKTHDLGDIPVKFIQRIGALAPGKQVKGYTKVVDCWKKIFNNSQEYVYGLIVEEPEEVIEPLVKKAKSGIKIQSVFSESAIVPDSRPHLVQKLGVSALTKKGTIERRMRKNIKVSVVLNEKESCIMFSSVDGEPDISKAFFSDEKRFHEWCLDYFRYSWYNSRPFREDMLK